MSNSGIRFLAEADSLPFKDLRLKSLRDDPDSWLSSIEEEDSLPDVNFALKIRSANYEGVFGYYGYFIDNKLLAYAQISSNYWNKKSHIVNLFDVCVSKEVRRKGIGTKLIRFITVKIKNARPEVEQIQLKVNSRNNGASKFYESFGFQKAATISEGVKEKDGSYQDECLYVLNVKTK